MDYSGPQRNGAVYGEEPPHYGGYYEAEQGNYGSNDNIDVSTRLKHDSSSSEGKLFVGGIAWETPKESLSLYFSNYGEVTNCIIMHDKISGRPRGFGFVTFADPEVAEKVLEENHVIDGRSVEVKRTVPRENVPVRGDPGTNKLFVGGLPLTLSEDDLREYFSSYGNVVGLQIMVDRETGRSRGFGFVTFDSEDHAERVLSDGRMHELGGKQVEIKRAKPKRSFDNSSQSQPRHGGSSSHPPGNSADGSEGFAGGQFRGAYGGYGGFGNIGGNFAGFYPGYGGYGYGYGYGAGAPFYGAAAYGGGGGGLGVPFGYGGAAGYGMHNGYNGDGGGGGEDEGFESNDNDGENGPGNSYGGDEYGGGEYGGGGSGGEYGGSRGNGNGNTKTERFHPYRK